jgi:PST family polysaccharide transporter
LVAILTRYLGVRGFGIYALVFAYVATFSGVFNDWGLGTICVREVSQNPDKRAGLLAAGATLQLTIAVLTYVVMLAIAAVLRYPSEVVEAIAVYGLTVLSAPLDILALPYQIDLQLRTLLRPSILGILLQLALTLVVVVAHGTVLALVGAALVALAAQYLWVGILSRQYVRGAKRPFTRHWGMYVKEAWPLFLATICTSLTQQGPILALSLISLENVALFSAAGRFPQQMALPVLMVRTSAFPVLSRFWVSDRARFARALDQLITVTTMVVLPIAILIGTTAPLVVRILFGSKFVDAATPLTLLMVVVVIMVPVTLVGEAMIAAGYQRVNLLIQTLSLPLMGIALWWMIPRFGVLGAAAAMTATYGGMGLGVFVAGRRLLGKHLPLASVGLMAIAGTVGVLTVVATRGVGPVMSGLSGAIAAVSVMILLRPRVARDLIRAAPRLGHKTGR